MEENDEETRMKEWPLDVSSWNVWEISTAMERMGLPEGRCERSVVKGVERWVGVEDPEELAETLVIPGTAIGSIATLAVSSLASSTCVGIQGLEKRKGEYEGVEHSASRRAVPRRGVDSFFEAGGPFTDFDSTTAVVKKRDVASTWKWDGQTGCPLPRLPLEQWNYFCCDKCCGPCNPTAHGEPAPASTSKPTVQDRCSNPQQGERREWGAVQALRRIQAVDSLRVVQQLQASIHAASYQAEIDILTPPQRPAINFKRQQRRGGKIRYPAAPPLLDEDEDNVTITPDMETNETVHTAAVDALADDNEATLEEDSSEAILEDSDEISGSAHISPAHNSGQGYHVTSRPWWTLFTGRRAERPSRDGAHAQEQDQQRRRFLRGFW
ncbi:hypothetical protein K469DRAFT_797785 [Zopfia rhizophila CBS 207.26]|uniref:Uncharacterized protein n=1 Tax=Zopfia rhizophila CBS 207.26 TaxID=1314779 RepID=A0A6A6DNA6_9PEZI|nr:hypothetical protein K469DRAFT_797785 [Zopfia rhizophila CBS 207.26]